MTTGRLLQKTCQTFNVGDNTMVKTWSNTTLEPNASTCSPSPHVYTPCQVKTNFEVGFGSTLGPDTSTCHSLFQVLIPRQVKINFEVGFVQPSLPYVKGLQISRINSCSNHIAIHHSDGICVIFCMYHKILSVACFHFVDDCIILICC